MGGLRHCGHWGTKTSHIAAYNMIARQDSQRMLTAAKSTRNFLSESVPFSGNQLTALFRHLRLPPHRKYALT